MKKYLVAILVLFCSPLLIALIFPAVVGKNPSATLKETGNTTDGRFGPAAAYGNKIGVLSVDVAHQDIVGFNETVPAVNPLTMFSQMP